MYEVFHFTSAYSAKIGVLIPSFQLYFDKEKFNLPLDVPVSTIVFVLYCKKVLKFLQMTCIEYF